MSGIDLVTLAAMLGHSRIQMVLRYAHPTDEHQMNAMVKLEAFNQAAIQQRLVESASAEVLIQ
jgi:hypothetical protein